jgi:hypothetical protein
MSNVPFALVLLALVALLLVIAVAAAITIVVVMTRRRSPAGIRPPGPQGPQDPFRDDDSDVLRGDPRSLTAGDILDIGTASLVVRGTLRMREGGYRWAEHLIDTGNGRREWLSVEEDPDLELVLWQEVDSPPPPPPGPRALQWRGTAYTLDESGQAEYASEANTGLAPTGTVRYFDYQGADGSLLSYEDFRGNGGYEVAVGRRLSRQELTIYPQAAR